MLQRTITFYYIVPVSWVLSFEISRTHEAICPYKSPELPLETEYLHFTAHSHSGVSSATKQQAEHTRKELQLKVSIPIKHFANICRKQNPSFAIFKPQVSILIEIFITSFATNAIMAPVPESTIEVPEVFYWALSITCGFLFSYGFTVILLLRQDGKEQKKELSEHHEDYLVSESGRRAAVQEAHLLRELLTKCQDDLRANQQRDNKHWKQLTRTIEFYQAHHVGRNAPSLHHLETDSQVQSESSSTNSSPEREDSEYYGPRLASTAEPQAGSVVPPLNLTQLANGDAAQYMVNNRYQMPEQIRFGDRTPINRSPARPAFARGSTKSSDEMAPEPTQPLAGHWSPTRRPTP